MTNNANYIFNSHRSIIFPYFNFLEIFIFYSHPAPPTTTQFRITKWKSSITFTVCSVWIRKNTYSANNHVGSLSFWIRICIWWWQAVAVVVRRRLSCSHTFIHWILLNVGWLGAESSQAVIRVTGNNTTGIQPFRTECDFNLISLSKMENAQYFVPTQNIQIPRPTSLFSASASTRRPGTTTQS